MHAWLRVCICVPCAFITHERLAEERVVVELTAQGGKLVFGGGVGPVGGGDLQPIASAVFFEAHGAFGVGVRTPACVVVRRQVLTNNNQTPQTIDQRVKQFMEFPPRDVRTFTTQGRKSWRQPRKLRNKTTPSKAKSTC